MRIELKALSVDAVVVDLKTCIRQLIERSPKSPYGIIGIGIGVPGMVNEAGTIRVRAKSSLGERFDSSAYC